MDIVLIIVAAALATLLVAREVTWRRAFARLQQRIAADGVQLRDREQLLQVGQLVSGLAQELKSPLQGVIGNTELMLATGGGAAESKDELREIQENVTRAAGIVRNLLAFTETSTLSRRWQDINELATRAVEGMKGPVVVHAVQHTAHRPIELRDWPDGDPRSRLVFITRGIGRGEIETLFTAVATIANPTAA